MQRLQIPKKTVKSLFLILKDVVLRRQMAVYFMVMLLPYQNQDRKFWKPSHNRHYPWCSDSPYAEILPNTFLKHPVEIRGVLMYDKRKLLGEMFAWVTLQVYF